jgi:hypothetical protein
MTETTESYNPEVQEQKGVRGDYFTDRLGGWTEMVLALASLGIVLSRFKKGILAADVALCFMYFSEIVGAALITRSKLPLMRVAFWIFTLRVIEGIALMGVVHGDKLARSTLGFPFVVAIYCWVRIRALRAQP